MYQIPKIERFDINPKIISAIEMYTSHPDLFKMQNRNTLNDDDKITVKRAIRDIGTMFDMVPTSSIDEIVWRSTQFDSMQLDEISPGQILRSFDNGFVSCTKSKRIAMEKSKIKNAIFRIIVPFGSHIVDISGVSTYPGGEEILLPGNSRFIVTDTSNSDFITARLIAGNDPASLNLYKSNLFCNTDGYCTFEEYAEDEESSSSDDDCSTTDGECTDGECTDGENFDYEFGEYDIPSTRESKTREFLFTSNDAPGCGCNSVEYL